MEFIHLKPTFLSQEKKVVLWEYHALYISERLPFKFLNQLTDLHEILYGCHAILG
jgi:hypothetical protein